MAKACRLTLLRVVIPVVVYVGELPSQQWWQYGLKRCNALIRLPELRMNRSESSNLHLGGELTLAGRGAHWRQTGLQRVRCSTTTNTGVPAETGQSTARHPPAVVVQWTPETPQPCLAAVSYHPPPCKSPHA